MRYRAFSNYVSFVIHLVSRAREYYKKASPNNASVPFLYVMHDGWDSKDFDQIGVSIQLVDPDSGRLLTVALGLQQLQGMESIEVADHIERILRR